MTDQKSAIEKMREQVGSRVAEEQQDLPQDVDTKETDAGTEMDLAFIRKCYLTNEIGDSVIFNALNRGQHIYNTISKEWLTYVGPHWDVDLSNRALSDVEKVAVQYLSLLEAIEKELEKIEPGEKGAASQRKALNAKKKQVISRLDRLRSDKGRVSVLRCAISNEAPLTVHPDQLDQHPYFFPVQNGVVDLRSGELLESSPDYYLTLGSTVEWQGLDAKAPTWENFLLTSLDGNQETVDFLLRALGYAISGLNIERLFVVLYGKHGQNGKGKLMEILHHVLGKLSGPIQTEMLMSQRYSRGADGPTPAVMALKGLRLAWASETEEQTSFASGKLKLYSGGDPLVGRAPNDKKQTTFYPSHVLFLLCNSLPSAPAWDSAFWERIKVIDFPLSFVVRKPRTDKDGVVQDPAFEKHERPADQQLLSKLKAEAPGILASLVRGFMEWQEKGLAPPQKVLDDSLKYRRSEDDIQDFIDQNCAVNVADPDYRTSSKDLYARYRVWWEEVATTRPMSMKKFGNLMSMKFEKKKSSGMVYLGIILDITKATGTDHG